MRAQEFENSKDTFVDIFRKFLPLAMKIIGLDSLPKIVFEKEIESPEQPTFGQYINDEHVLYVGLANRHPNDILRTVAHELVHYYQDTEHKLNDMSGTTGSPEENEANALAGVVMRNFNKLYPEYLKVKPIVVESWSEKYKRSINCSNPKGFSQRAHCQGRKKDESIEEKLNRTGSNELVIFDIDDTLLHTTAQIKVIDSETGKPKLSLTNQQFNNYKLKPGEEFDFGEFRDAAKFEEESVPIGPMLDKLRSDLAAGKNVVMLTARADFDNQKVVWRTFKRHGIDINQDVHLYRAGNQPGDSSPAVKKAIHVSEWLSSGKYNRVVMYDDSEKNLSVFKSLEKRFPNVEFEAHHVSEKGDTRQIESAGDRGDIPTGPGEQLIPFPQGTTMVDVSDIYDWYKLGMVISDLDDADPKIFSQGAPHTVIAFGSEEEEHKLLPLLKRLGLTVHDIDRPEDVKKAIPAKMLARDLAETIRKVGSQYRLVSKQGKNLGTYPTHAGAEKRERQVQYFKHIKEGFDDEAEKYRNYLEKTLPQIMQFLKGVNGAPTEEQMRSAIDVAVDVMKRTGDIKQAAKAKKDFLDSILSQNKQGVAEGEVKQFPKKHPYELLTKCPKCNGPLQGGTDEKGRLKLCMPCMTIYRAPNQQDVAENFADGRNPQDKGDSARYGIRKGMTIAQLKKIRSNDSASPRKKQLAHWQINMRQGRKK